MRVDFHSHEIKIRQVEARIFLTMTGLRPIRSVASPAGVSAAAWNTAAIAKAIPVQPVSRAYISVMITGIRVARTPIDCQPWANPRRQAAR